MRLAFPIFVLASLVACAHRQSAQQPTAETPRAVSPAPAPGGAASDVAAPVACRSDADCASNQLCLENRCTAITPGLAACSSARVHFEFDQSLIRAEDRDVLARVARCLGADPTGHLVVEGNADERGTTEYNVALGQRRADVVKRYLEDLGVSGRQVETVSYGAENPICDAHDESCWAQNRRDDLKTGAELKADAAARP